MKTPVKTPKKKYKSKGRSYIITDPRHLYKKNNARNNRAKAKQRLDLLERHEPVMKQKIALLQALVEKQFVYARHQENLVSRIAMCSLTLSDIGLNSSSTAFGGGHQTPSCRTSLQ